MTDKLKPCPFCGKPMQRRDYDGACYTDYCANCGAIGPNELTEQRADEMWNLRRGEDSLCAQLAERDAMIKRLDKADGTAAEKWRALIAEWKKTSGATPLWAKTDELMEKL